MRSTVVVDVNGLDRHLLEFETSGLCGDDLFGFEFVAIRANTEAQLHEPARYPTQPCLSVGQIEADQEAINVTRDDVAEPAAERNIALEIARTEHRFARPRPQFICNLPDVTDRML